MYTKKPKTHLREVKHRIMIQNNFDPNEINKFDQIATRWWDKTAECKPLHDINPLRMSYIQKQVNLKDKHVIDVGCGGGILTEALAARGAIVTGIDMAQEALTAAKQHAQISKLTIDYQQITAEAMATHKPGQFDVVTCMEMLEHVPDPLAIIKACATLVKTDGHVFFSTLNRNLKSFLFAIVGAEYLLNLIPHGTHEYAKFIRPTELATWIRENDLTISSMIGISYHPLTRQYSLTADVSVNYLLHARA
ncbi:bifunctional 3-demethylubiquinone 3-O-methyltransferase/2-octaprenyl-6-hydroxy phenol methylase [soil metagenome]